MNNNIDFSNCNPRRVYSLLGFIVNKHKAKIKHELIPKIETVKEKERVLKLHTQEKVNNLRELNFAIKNLEADYHNFKNNPHSDLEKISLLEEKIEKLKKKLSLKLKDL